MANVLVLEPNNVAACALQGILVRGGHRCVIVATADEAWKALHDLVIIDLVIMELETKGERGMNFIRRLRGDCTLKEIPILVYSQVFDTGEIRRTLALKIQDFLTKPYNDDLVYREIAKAVTYPWRKLQFEEEKSFCAQLGYTLEELRKQREDLLVAVQAGIPNFPQWAQSHDSAKATHFIANLADSAEAVGVWAVANYLRELEAQAEADNWDGFGAAAENLDFVRRLTFCHLYPDHLPEGFLSEQERMEKEDAIQRGIWERAILTAGVPFVSAKDVERRLDELAACPAIDAAVAAFQMAANGMASSLGPVTDLVTKDPGLCVQVLVAANRLERDDTEPVEDIRTAVNLLGEIRLSSLAKAVPAVAERFFRSTPITWTQYWTFQVGVGRVARFVCDNLEMTDIAPYAYAAGLMHDIGKLILMRIFPFALPAMAGHAKANGIPLAEAEQRYTGWTSRKIGERFAQQSGLPPTYGDVIRWADNPEAATDHRDLVAAVALARELCHKSHLGQSFDFVKEAPVVVEALPAWSILQQRAFVGFNLRAFEAAAYAFCLKQKQELAGREQWHGAG